MTEFLSCAEFAELVGRSERTIQRYVRSQKIESQTTLDGIRIHRNEALKLTTLDDSSDDTKRQAATEFSEDVAECRDVSSAVADKLSLAVATVYKALERSEKLEAQLVEERTRAEMEEKRRLGLEFELTRYRCVLTENAESLAEERARRIQFECLEAENAKAREQWEAERADLVEKLKLSESRVSWMEQRVPRWVRSLFKAV